MARQISIAVPVYRTEDRLPACLHSICAQDEISIELIIVNDGSNQQKIQQICASLPKNEGLSVNIIQHPLNRGLLAARLTAIRAATSPYFMHLDADDTLQPNSLFRVLEQCQHRQSACLLFSVNEHMGGQQSVRQFSGDQVTNVCQPYDVLATIRDSLAANWLWHVSWNKVWRTERLKHSLQNFEFNQHLVMFEDLLLTVYCFSRLDEQDCIVLQSGDPVVNYVRHVESVSRRKKTKNSIIKNCNDTILVVRSLRAAMHERKLHDGNYEKLFEAIVDKNFPPMWMLRSNPLSYLKLILTVATTVNLRLFWSKAQRKLTR